MCVKSFILDIDENPIIEKTIEIIVRKIDIALRNVVNLALVLKKFLFVLLSLQHGMTKLCTFFVLKLCNSFINSCDLSYCKHAFKIVKNTDELRNQPTQPNSKWIQLHVILYTNTATVTNILKFKCPIIKSYLIVYLVFCIINY